MNNEKFIDVITKGNLKACKKYYREFKPDIHDSYDWAFRQAACCGYLDICKWLYNLDGVDTSITTRVLINACDDYAFRCAAINGHLDVCKWLYNIGGVNVHACNDMAFRWAAYTEHLKVCKWLYSLGGIDIHAWDDWIFKHCSEEVIAWLSSLK